MKRITLSLLSAAGLLTAASYAQQIINRPNNPSIFDEPGVLGKSYADVGLSLERIHAQPDAAYNAEFSGNMPLARGIDGRLGYNYWWYNYSGTKSYYHLVTADSRFYRQVNRVKLFGGALLGYEWSKESYNGYLTPPTSTTAPATPTTPTATPAAPVTTTTTYGNTTRTTTTTGAETYLSSTTRDNYGVWGLSAGVEVPMAGFAFTPHVAYLDTMQSRSNWGYHYGAEVHHWFNETYGGYFDVTYNDVRHEPNSWSYTVGMRARF